MPSAPKSVKPPLPPPTPVDADVLAARSRQRRALINSQGFRSTILTGPGGLGPGLLTTLSPSTLLSGGPRA